jgi:hypothetical protein
LLFTRPWPGALRSRIGLLRLDFPQHRDEDVFQRRLDGADAQGRDAAFGQQLQHALGGPRGVVGDHVDAVAEQAHRLPVQALAEQVASRAGLGGADFEDRAPHQPLDLVGRTEGQQPAAVDQGHAVAALRLVEIRRGDEDRHPLAQQLVEDPPEVAPRDRVHAVGRLVEEEHPGRMD